MRTFDVKFKRKVVREYVSGKGGYKILAAKFDIADSQVRRWVGAYQHHGSTGLVRQRGRYTCEFKLKCCTASRPKTYPAALAAMYNIGNPHSITMWQRQHERGELRSPQDILPLDNLVPAAEAEGVHDITTSHSIKEVVGSGCAYRAH